MYAGEMTAADELDKKMAEAGIGADLDKIRPAYFAKVKEIMDRATLSLPKDQWFQEGGKKGHHTENLGFILADLQFMQRTYPGLDW
jgi:ring-1,2-phenylacetyl-CoA epoxidase subunit PaaC